MTKLRNKSALTKMADLGGENGWGLEGPDTRDEIGSVRT